ncbi:MAG: hypothetical protein NTU76_02070 [Candidatus Taylorbacteria bacterium]|nr:hypothetical protein [Candidatus Taylorbacteria bacterium]
MINSTQADNKNQPIYNWVTETLGWYGVVAVVLAYALLSFKILNSDSLLFQGLNLTGAIV